MKKLRRKQKDLWHDFWSEHRVVVNSQNAFDQLALDFACYHLQIMTPDDSQFSVAAKGLTGEGLQRSCILGYRNIHPSFFLA